MHNNKQYHMKEVLLRQKLALPSEGKVSGRANSAIHL